MSEITTIKIEAAGKVFEFTPEEALAVHAALDRRIVSFIPSLTHVNAGIAGTYVLLDDPDELRKMDWNQ
jgi:hypothetical protein